MKDLKYERNITGLENQSMRSHITFTERQTWNRNVGGRNYQGSDIRIFSKVQGGEAPDRKGPAQ